MPLGVLDADRFALLVTSVADDKGHLQFEVQQLARTEFGCLFVVGFGLSVWSVNFGATDHHRRRSAMVGNRQMQPVRQQRIVFTAKHLANIAGVLFGGIEIGVVADLHWQMHLHILLQVQAFLTQSLVVSERRNVFGEQRLQCYANVVPDLRRFANERIQGRLVEQLLGFRFIHDFVHAEQVHNLREVQNVFTDRDTWPWIWLKIERKKLVRSLMGNRLGHAIFKGHFC